MEQMVERRVQRTPRTEVLIRDCLFGVSQKRVLRQGFVEGVIWGVDSRKDCEGQREGVSQ